MALVIFFFISLLRKKVKALKLLYILIIIVYNIHIILI